MGALFKNKHGNKNYRTIQESYYRLFSAVFVEDFKKQFIPKEPNKEFNYLTDIYSKWYQDYFYLCEKYKSERPDRIAAEFEMKFVRLKCTGKNQFNFSYFRHTGQWHLVATSLTLDECRGMILSNRFFSPLNKHNNQMIPFNIKAFQCRWLKIEAQV